MSWSGAVYSIDATTGSGALLGPSGFTNLNSMAKDGAGMLLTASDNIAPGPPRLIEINPVSGVGTFFHFPFLNHIRALAFSPEGTLYAADGFAAVRWLYTLDLSVPPGDSSIKELVGELTFGSIQGMTFAPDGTLYAWDTGRGLVTIDPETAVATDVNGLFDGSSAIQSLAFAPDGTLYGVHDELYSIELATGATALVGSGGFDEVRGFAFLDGPISSDLDIKPGSCPNSYNRSSHGVLPVALVGTDSFDVSQVDLGSLLLMRTDGEGGSVAPNFGPPGPHPTIGDVATPFEGEECDCHEATGDGIDDLMMHFRTDDVVANLDLNSFSPGALVPLTLTGTTLDGTEFEVDDCVRLVPPGTAPGLLAVMSNLPGAWIDLTPPDNTIDEGGFANFVRTYPLTTEVTLTAPSAQFGWVFVGWNLVTPTGPFGSKSPVQTGDRVNTLIRSRSLTLAIETALEVVEAVYEPGDGPDPSNAPPTSHRGDDGIDDAPNDPTDDPPSSPGVPRR